MQLARQIDMPELLDRDGAFTVSAPAGGATRISWSSVGRSGRAARATIELSAEGVLRCDRPFTEWSAPPLEGSHVIVAPDVPTFFAFRRAIGRRSIIPFVITAPVPGLPLPGEWFDPGYWRFERITILSNGLDASADVVGMFADMSLPAVGVSRAPYGTTWRELATRGGRVGYEELEAIAEAALPIVDFRRIVLSSEDDLALIDRTCRQLDEKGRLLRLEGVGAGVGRPVRLIRSDGSRADCVPRRSLRRLPPAMVDPLTGGSWARAAADAYLEGAPSPGSAEIGRRLREIVTARFILHPADARALCSYVALTYVFAGFADLPLLVIRCGAELRIDLRRLLQAICNRPAVVTRSRAMQLARIADAGSGVMILDEPGPACGPAGATELGRFLESGLHRDASPYMSASRTFGMRTLDAFGPKILVGAAASSVGLACASRTLEIHGASQSNLELWPEEGAAVRDGLHAWSMALIAASRGAPARCRPDAVLALLEAEMFGRHDPDGGAASPRTGLDHLRGRPDQLSPRHVMEEVMATCGAGGHLSMIEIMLEVALRGGGGEEFSPERIGRWISSHPRVDRSRAVERRRLHGQISRIYPLVDGREGGDAGEAFVFCLSRSCEECRFDSVCGSVMPALKSRKEGILGAKAADEK